VSALFGLGGLATIVYILVGVSALYVVLTHKDDCKSCEMMMKPAKKGKRK
jgi:uncharacterized membrane protein YuzA (DUF378 family)